MPPAGPATRGLCIALVATTLGASLLDGASGALTRALAFDRVGILHGELWRLVTYATVKVSSPLSLIIAAVVLWLFGGMYESRWGTRRFLRFFIAAAVGAAAIAVPLGLLLEAMLPISDSPMASGPDGAIDALLMAMVLAAPNAQVLFGFVLPVPARALVWLLLGLDVVACIMTRTSQLSLTAGGLAMGYLLTTGQWRPSTWRRLLSEWQRRRRRHGLYVVPPKGKKRWVN
jgi:membrane associated rhomboid family serine protease